MIIEASMPLKKITLDERVIKILEKYDDLILAGGALRGCFGENEVIADYDLFFKDLSSAPYVQVSLESLGFETIFVCPEGKLTTLKKDDVKVQLIKERIYSSPKVLIDTFDINACRIALYKGKIYTCKQAIEDCEKKQITLNLVDFPVATFKRMVKYMNKGYTLHNTDIQNYVDMIYNKGINSEKIDTRFYVD